MVPDPDQLARRIRNADVGMSGMDLMRRLDLVDQLARIICPTLVCVGEVDPVTPPAASREIVGALPVGVGQLRVIDGAGHFPWLDRPDEYWSIIGGFVDAVTRQQTA
jgi:pimeloyl-ACP methyl ester carboxylesterase